MSINFIKYICHWGQIKMRSYKIFLFQNFQAFDVKRLRNQKIKRKQLVDVTICEHVIASSHLLQSDRNYPIWIISIVRNNVKLNSSLYWDKYNVKIATKNTDFFKIFTGHFTFSLTSTVQYENVMYVRGFLISCCT